MKTEEERTRDRVARSILEKGPRTAADLASELGLTAAAVRRHLDGLLAAGLLEAREPYVSPLTQRGRGRPAKVFVLTETGRERFEQQYDDLALSALRFLGAQMGEGAITTFAEQRAMDFERRHPISGEADHRVGQVAEALSLEGYAATVHQLPIGHELCQHHCPVAHVATQYPQLCEAETAALSRMLGTHVQRLATIAHGDGVCTTFIPATFDPATFDPATTNHARRQA